MKTMRRMAIVVSAIALVSLVVSAALIWWLGPTAGFGAGLAGAAVVVGSYVVAIGPWQRRWGATEEEVHRAMPGDEILGPGAPSTTRAITIDARSHDVFPWLLQIGYGRGGWYSYDWLDNDGRPSVGRIDPSLQDLAVGDRIQMLPAMGPTVREIARDHYIVSGGESDSWCLLVEPADDGRTRLISRWRQRWPNTVGTYVWIAIADPGAFVMEQKMLRTIRDLAQGDAAVRPVAEAQ